MYNNTGVGMHKYVLEIEPCSKNNSIIINLMHPPNILLLQKKKKKISS